MANGVNLITVKPDKSAAELAKRLGTSKQLVGRAITEHLREYGRALVTNVKEEAPVGKNYFPDQTAKHGILKQSVRYKIEGANTGNAKLIVSAGNKERPEVVVKSVLFGTLGHWIPKGKMLDVKKLYTFVGKDKKRHWRGWHPGTKPNDFLERGYNKTMSERRSLSARLGKMIVDWIKVGQRTR